MAGASTATLSIGSSCFPTPAEVYDMDDDEMTSEEAARIRAEIKRYLQRQQQAKQQTSSTARSDLDVAHRQSLPAGIEFHRRNTGGTDEMPPLEAPTEIAEEEEEEEEEEFEDDEEEMPKTTQKRKHKETIDHSTKITKWQDRSVQEEDIRFQLFLRGIELTHEQEDEISKLEVKGKGRNQTRKDYLINNIERMIQTRKWTDEINDQLLQQRMVEWLEMKKG